MPQRTPPGASLSPLRFMAGRRVREHIEREGFRLEDFPTLLGAAGGAKWLVLHGLDRVLAPRVQAAARQRGAPVHLVGASIGAWRFAAWAQRDPAAAIDRLLASYTDFEPFRSGSWNMDDVFERYLDALLGPDGTAEVLASDHAVLHVVVAWYARSRLPAAARIGSSVLSNAFSRDRFLARGVQRVVFSSGPPPPGADPHWPARHVDLDAANLKVALRASASIPGFVTPLQDIVPGARGRALDGGLVDYHFDDALARDQFVLYPHFYPHMVPGWFDKPFRRRRVDPAAVDNLLLLTPSEAFVAALPGGRIPNRKDAQRLGLEACHQAWTQVTDASRRLGDALEEALDRQRIEELILRSA